MPYEIVKFACNHCDSVFPTKDEAGECEDSHLVPIVETLEVEDWVGSYPNQISVICKSDDEQREKKLTFIAFEE